MEKKGSVFRKLVFLLTLFLSPLLILATPPDQGILLYTAYTSQSVTPGKTLTYNIEIINETEEIQNVNLSLRGVPNSWEPSLTAGTNSIQKIAVKPKTFESENAKEVELKLNVPLKISKGYYTFELFAETDSGMEFLLPLNVQVTEQGVFRTEMQVDQANMEGYADSDFNYNFTLNNQTAREQNYALSSAAPPGWDVRFRVGGNYATSVAIGSNESENISVQVTPPEQTEADTSEVVIRATSGSTSARDTLEAVIKGKYDLNLSTPSSRLSTEVTAGGEQTIELLLENSGTVPLRDISLNASAPAEWKVDFENEEVTRLGPGKTTTVDATIAASSKAIAGDYRLQIDADTPEASSEATFRVTVSKSIVWGSAGIFIILVVVGGIAFLFKRYGRR